MKRPAFSLTEILVAISLGSLILGLLTRAVVTQRGGERTVAAQRGSAVAAEDAVRIVARMLSGSVAADSVRLRGDTAIEWNHIVGVALSCLATGDSVVVAEAGISAWWQSAPESGDLADIVLADGSITRHPVTEARSSATGACGVPQRVLRLANRSGDGSPVVVRVTRRIRMSLYKGGEGNWWLGQRICGPTSQASCGAAQPVAGPLSASPNGLRFLVEPRLTGSVVTINARSGRVTRTAVSGIAR